MKFLVLNEYKNRGKCSLSPLKNVDGQELEDCHGNGKHIYTHVYIY